MAKKCTAIRRVIVPEAYVEDVQIALGKSLSKIAIGNPTTEGVRMGALASKDQVQEVRDRVNELCQTAELVYGHLDQVNLLDADAEKGAFLSPILLLEKNPHQNQAVHDVEAFGPVSTIIPYQDLGDAVHLAKMGKGSLCASITTYDDQIAREFVIGAASHHGRILVSKPRKCQAKHRSWLTLAHLGAWRPG